MQSKRGLKAANGGELVFHVQQKNKNYQNNKKLFPPSTNQKEYDKCVTIRWWPIDCHFGDSKCTIQFNKECVGLASRQDKLYFLSLSENKNASSYENHISRGRIERLVKASILLPLEFLELEQYIDCIKGKFAKKIKNDWKRWINSRYLKQK